MAGSTCIEAVDLLAELDVQNLAIVRGERLVQRDLNFRVKAGEMLSIAGRNGAGKTSLLRAIAGLLEPRSGTIICRLSDGRAVAAGEERGPFIGWVGHQDGVKSQLTLGEQLRFHEDYYRCQGDIGHALARAGLARMRDLPAQYLSAGQRRRFAYARLMLGRRPLWLLDEPLSALDNEGRAFVRALIERHCFDGGIVLAATHEPLHVSGARLELS